MMNNLEIQKLINKTNSSIDESNEIMNENPLFQTLSGIAGRIGVNIKGMGSKIGGAVLSFAKEQYEEAKQKWLDSFKERAKEAKISSDMQDRMLTAGVPEAILAAPCAWYILDAEQRSMKDEDFLRLIDKYGVSLSPEALQWKDYVTSKLEESYRRDTQLIIDSWLPIITEAISDYSGMPVPPWAQDAALNGRRGSAFAKNEWFKTLNDDQLASLIISAQIVGDPEKDETRLAAMYAEKQTEKQKKYTDGVDRNAEKTIDNIVFIHANLVIGGRAKGIISLNPNKISDKIYPMMKDAVKSKEKWTAAYKKEEKEYDDVEAIIGFLSGKKKEETEEEVEGIETDMSTLDVIKKILKDPSWYLSVQKSLGNAQGAQIAEYGKTIQESMGEQLANGLKPETLAAVPAAGPIFKKAFDTFVNEDPELKQFYEYAKENSDDEIGSRILAMFRPAYATEFVEFVKKDFQIGGPKLDKLIAQASAAGYESSKDPMLSNFKTESEKIKAEVVKGFSSGLDELTKLGEQAEKEIGEIMAAKAKESEEDEEAPEVIVTSGEEEWEAGGTEA